MEILTVDVLNTWWILVIIIYFRCMLVYLRSLAYPDTRRGVTYCVNYVLCQVKNCVTYRVV